MNFVLDIGNTNVKAAIFDAHQIVATKTVSLGDLGNIIDEYIESFHPKFLIASSVSATEQELGELIQNRLEWFLFSNQTPLPIRVEYHTRHTLGTDRLAGIMAVYNEYPKQNVLVIDSGTCITYDMLSEDNRYFGGSISPGLEMRYKAVHQFTRKLPDLSPVNHPNLVGQSTAESIHSGIFNGILFEIDGVIQAYQKQFGNLVVIGTGGNLRNLATYLKNTIFADQNLVLKGLNNILIYHYQSE
jgi:type III pantothenate kinase